MQFLEKSGKKKAHKHNIVGSVALGMTPRLSRGQNPFVLGQTQVFPHFALEAQFVAGTNLVCSNGRKVYVSKIDVPLSMPNMTGRPGYRTMEMNGGSSAPYLACTPCVPLFCALLNRGGTEELLDYQGRAGIISIVRWNLRPVIVGVDFVAH